MKIYKNLIHKASIFIVLIFVFLLYPFFTNAIYLDQTKQINITPVYTPGEVIVKFKDSSFNLNKIKGASKMEPGAIKEQALFSVAESFGEKENIELQNTMTSGNLGVFKTTDGESVESLISRLKENPNIESVEPNYTYEPATISTNDTFKNLLWELDNIGQVVNGITGTADADIDAPEAWEINNDATNTPVIVAIIDNGVAYNHPDLVTNMWDGTNCKDENGIFLGGCIHGYNYEYNAKNPLPSGDGTVPAHATHIAGIIGATKNNGMGVTSLSQNVKIMALSTAYTNDNIIKAIDFARENGAKVINASWGSVDSSTFMYDAIKRFTDSGGIFIAAAHNYTRNNDTTPLYPASYNIDGIISVAATDQNDNLASYSDWGPTSVDVAAPGSNIYSTYCSIDCITQSYGYMSGTSMATPEVVGLAAFIWGNNPTLSNLAVKNIILSTGDTLTSLNGKVLTNKRINAFNSLNSLASLSSYSPNAGYTADNIIPASQINYDGGTGNITVNFKVKDTYPNITEQLSDFSYSTDSGTTWQTPVYGDNSLAMSDNWKGNNYISKTDYSGTTYNFVFNSKNTDATGLLYYSGSNVKIRFKVNDGLNTSNYITSDAFTVSNFTHTLNIIQPTNPISINADNYDIIGNTNAGSLVQIYRDTIIVGSHQLDSTETDFLINVPLNKNTDNIFTVKVTEPVNNLEKTLELPSITEADDVVISTQPATSLNTTTATLNGNITSIRSTNLTVRGFNYGLDINYGTDTIENGIFSTGSYTANITSLACGTTYHYRSYATNSTGTSYGNDVLFTTNTCHISSGGGGGGGILNPISKITIPVKTSDDCKQGEIFNTYTGQKCTIITSQITYIPAFITFTRTLKQGMNNNDVKSLQNYLNNHGYNCGTPDGSFGNKTKQAVMLFQKANNLKLDGVVGKGTRSLMK